jgi:hypothetical protein
MATQCAPPPPAPGRATSATPARPMRPPSQARTVQGWPFRRRPSSSVSQSGTVATISAAMPLGMLFSDHMTSPLPTPSSSAPTSA